MLFCLVAKEFWRRYKLGVLVAAVGTIAIAALWATGVLWHFETWCRAALPIGRLNPIVLFSFLIGAGMACDACTPRRRR